MAYRIQLRRDLAFKWESNNPVLLLGEFGYEYDTGYAKIGDGQSPWIDLDYFGGTGGGVSTFKALTDTPGDYSGANQYYVRVNPSATALEFVPIETISSTVDLRGATGYTAEDAGRYFRVNAGATGLEWATVAGGTGGGSYYNLTPTISDVGGITEGSTFNNVILDTMWNALLHPEEEPGFSSVYITAFGGTAAYDSLEVGQGMDTTVDLYWTPTNPSDFKPGVVSVYDVTGATGMVSGLGATGSPQPYTRPGGPFTKSSKGSNVFRWTGIGSNEITFTKDYTINWYYPIFTGRNTTTTLTNLQVTSLTNRLLQTDSSGNYSFPAGATADYIYVCLPDADTDYDISAITVNGLPIVLADSTDGYTSTDSSGFNYNSVTSVNTGYVTITYRVYRTKNKIPGAITINVSNNDLAVGLRITGTLSPMEETDTYPIMDPKYGIDGFRNVDLLSEMYAIPQPRRKLGMVVGVGITGESGIYYKLINEPGTTLTTITDWDIFNSGILIFQAEGITGATGPSIINLEGNIEVASTDVTVTLLESPAGTANYSINIPQIISGGTATNV